MLHRRGGRLAFLARGRIYHPGRSHSLERAVNRCVHERGAGAPRFVASFVEILKRRCQSLSQSVSHYHTPSREHMRHDPHDKDYITHTEQVSQRVPIIFSHRAYVEHSFRTFTWTLYAPGSRAERCTFPPDTTHHMATPCLPRPNNVYLLRSHAKFQSSEARPLG